MVSAEENRRNLRSAENVVAHEMGVDPANLTYEQRIDFNKRLAAKILQYPARFTSGAIAAAEGVAGGTYQPLADPSFSVADFASEYLAPIGVVGTGAAKALEGAGTALAWGKWALPIVGLIALGILLLGLKKRVA